jgi:hypothetical protein
VALIAGAVFLTANVQRSAVMLGARQQETSESMLNAILNQETGARGFYESRPLRSIGTESHDKDRAAGRPARVCGFAG